jgi:hypothetical protein
MMLLGAVRDALQQLSANAVFAAVERRCRIGQLVQHKRPQRLFELYLAVLHPYQAGPTLPRPFS